MSAALALTAAAAHGNPATFSRTTRPVTAAEIAGGAPASGFVHDFFITTTSDLLLIEGDANVPIYQHPLGSDVAPPWGDAALIPGITADSFVTLPGETSSLGGFGHTAFTPIWYDVTNNGPQQDFNFARLTTVGQTGTYAGKIFVNSHVGFGMPFTFILPGSESDLHLLDSEGPYSPPEEEWYGPAMPPPPPPPPPTAKVTFVSNPAGRFVDIFYTVSPGGEFTNWDLVAAPSTGSILDPNTNQRSFNVVGGVAPVDTFANTVFSSVGAGPASYFFAEYNPGSAFPPVPAQPAPTAGASAPNPDVLNWSIYDVARGDGNIAGSFPYHMARVVYSEGGSGSIQAQFFDTTNVGVGETFSFSYYDGIIPEPGAGTLAGFGLLGVFGLLRMRYSR